MLLFYESMYVQANLFCRVFDAVFRGAGHEQGKISGTYTEYANDVRNSSMPSGSEVHKNRAFGQVILETPMI